MRRKIAIVPAMLLGLIAVLPVCAQEAGPLPAAPARQIPAQGTDAHEANRQAVAASPSTASAGAPVSSTSQRIEVPTGTHIPLVLHNAISTRSARPGDPVYFETLFPVMVNGHVAIPAGSYVSGEVTESKRPGRVKGRGELMIKLTTMILPNAYMVNLNAVPGSGAGTVVARPSIGKVK